MINTLSKINLSKINLSKIGWERGGSTSIWIMSLNILGFFWTLPRRHRWIISQNPKKHTVTDREDRQTEEYTYRAFILNALLYQISVFQ